MPSPFPGMDPYLEHPALWRDFHQRLTGQIGEQLAPRLRPRYVARLETRVFVEIPDAEEIQILYPDVSVLERAPKRARKVAMTYDAAITPAPAENVTIVPIRVKQVTIEIREAATHRLVTAIEMLSPANKRVGSAGYFEYRNKRARLLASDTHLLEIDLLRKGARVEMVNPLPPAPYYVILAHTQRRPTRKVWPIQLSERLPVAPVPLLEPDPDVPLDLNAAVATVYERAAYDLSIDYRRAPVPPLEGADAASTNLQRINE
ncbi:MAG: DUF4058 family protein [Chloroflexota bacterium]